MTWFEQIVVVLVQTLQVAADLLSRRAHNYTPCWLSFTLDGVTGACLDQLWVR
jgi:hypothetical protein